MGYSVKRMRAKRFLLLLILGVALLAGGVALWAFNTDLGRFQPTIERWLSQTLERETRFGALRLELGRSVLIEARDLRIANQPGAPAEDFLRLETLKGAVDLASLLDEGPVLIERLTASGLDLNLSWDENARGNWPLAETGEGQDAAPATADPPTALVTGLDTLVEDAHIVLAWPTHENRIDLERLSVAEIPASGMLDLSFTGRIDGAPMAFDGEVGPRVGLITGGDVSFEGRGRLSGLRAEGRVVLDDLTAPDRPELEVELSGPDIREVERLLGLAPGPEQDYALTIDAGAENSAWRLQADGRIGSFTLDADGELSGLQSLDRVRLEVLTAGPDLNGVLRLLRVEDAPAEPFRFEGRVRRDGPTLAVDEVGLRIGSATFELDGELSDFPHLRDSTLDLDVRGQDIAAFRALFRLPGAADGPFELTASISPGEDELDLLTARLVTNLGTLDGSGTISGDDRYVGSTVSLSARGFDALDSLAPFGIPGLRATPYTLDIDFEVGEEGLVIENAALVGLWDARLEASGLAGFDPLRKSTDLEMTVSGPDLAATLGDFAVDWPLQSGAYDVSARLRATPGGMRVENLLGTVNRSSLQAAALIPLHESLAGMELELSAEGPDLSAIFSSGETLAVPSEAWRVGARLQRVDSRLLLEDATLNVAEIRLSGSGETPWPLRPGEGAFTLRGEGPDLSAAVPRVSRFRLADLPFSLEVAADIRGGAWSFSPSHFELGRSRLDLAGTVDALPDFSATNLELDLAIPDLAESGSWEEFPLPALRLGLESTLAGSPTSLRLDDYLLSLGDSTATGSLALDMVADRPRLDVRLLSDRLDLRGAFPQPANGTAGPAAGADGRVIPDTTLPLGWLDDIDGAFDLEIGLLETDRRLVSDLRIDLNLRDGSLDLTRYRSTGVAGSLDARGGLRLLEDGRTDIDLELIARDLVLARDAWLNADPTTLPRINALGEARATGATLRELAAGLNGRLRVAASRGKLPGNGLGALDAVLLEQLLSILIPGINAREPTELLCLAANLEITDGLVRPEPMIALHTSKLTILSTGTINLENEKIDLQFQTTPSNLLSSNLAELANPFVSIGGTLADPKPVIDPSRTIVYGGAAAATAGISVIAKALWDRLRGASRPCERLREELAVEDAVLRVTD